MWPPSPVCEAAVAQGTLVLQTGRTRDTDPHADYGPLNRIATNRIDTRLIAANYDDILRVAGSLLQRATTAS